MTKQETDAIDCAIYALASATDTLPAAERAKLMDIMQQLADLSGGANIAAWLAEHQMLPPQTAPTAEAESAVVADEDYFDKTLKAAEVGK